MTRVVHFIYDWKPNHGGAEKLLSHLQDCQIDSYEFYYTVLLKTEVNSVVSLGSSKIYGIGPLVQTIKYSRTFSTSDIIHAHLFPSTYYLAIAKLLGVLKAKLVITEHNSTNRRRKLWLRWLDGLMYTKFDAIVCISEGVKASLVEWLPAVKEKSYVVYNGTKISANNDFNRNNDNSKLLSVGRLVEQKNYIQTLEILSPIIKDLNLNYTIAGEGVLRAVIENTIKDLKIQPKVKLLGRIPDVTQEYQSHNLFLILSKWEGFGLACVEALSYGLRIIASDVQGMREILLPLIGKGVLLVSLNDTSENIRIQIQEFILQPDTKSNFDLRKQRAKDFDINITAKGYTKVYHSLNRV